MDAAGINSNLFFQGVDDTWSTGALVEMILDLCYWLGPPSLGVAMYRTSGKRAAWIVGGWFLSILLYIYLLC